MNKTIALQFIATSALLTWASGALAHDGHGLLGSHWHPSDSLGFVAVAVLTAAAVWLSQKK
ncbi:MAG: hypothetical protein ACKVOT_03700 [Polaromonas sp.]